MPDHAAHDAPAAHSLARVHVLVACVLVLLTAAAFAAAGFGLLPGSILFPALLVLAAAQVALQATYYMRLRWDRRRARLFFATGLGLAALISVTVKVLMSARG